MNWIIIGLVVLVVAIGLLFAIFKLIFEAVVNIEKLVNEKYESITEKRRQSRRGKLANFVSINIPEDISNLKKNFDSLEKSTLKILEQIKLFHFHIEDREWQHCTFLPFKFQVSRDSSNDLLISDLSEILTLDQTTWANELDILLKRACKYPSALGPFADITAPPKSIPDVNMAIEEATFVIYENYKDSKMVSEIQDLFGKERRDIEFFNSEREKILERIKELNDELHSANEKVATQWSEYQKKLPEVREEEQIKYDAEVAFYIKACEKEKNQLREIFCEYEKGTKSGVEQYFDKALSTIALPLSVPHAWSLEFDEKEKIAIIEMSLPNVVHNPPQKIVSLKKGNVIKPLNKDEQKNIVPTIHPALMLRFAVEIFRNDTLNKIQLLALNGWIKFHDPRTGVLTRAYTASLMVKRDEVINLNLKKIDPIAAFNSLKGMSAGKIAEIIPINPVLKLNKKDSRFVEAKPVIEVLDTKTNLASMDWQDFEHLIRELFERVFAKDGVEVRVTQASRDRGVDAIVFDPDPIKGGKFIIQAKRYTNTVDVSAVRDLCAVVQKEGASRGILVTTSSFGADSYEFAKGAPITLINGSELLGLLQQHGYRFRIDIDEARKLNKL